MLIGSILIEEQKYSLNNLFIINKLFNIPQHTKMNLKLFYVKISFIFIQTSLIYITKLKLYHKQFYTKIKLFLHIINYIYINLFTNSFY